MRFEIIVINFDFLYNFWICFIFDKNSITTLSRFDKCMYVSNIIQHFYHLRNIKSFFLNNLLRIITKIFLQNKF